MNWAGEPRYSPLYFVIIALYNEEALPSIVGVKPNMCAILRAVSRSGNYVFPEMHQKTHDVIE